VAAAVAVLERLHTGPLLFPNTLLINGRAEGCLQTRVGLGRSDQLTTKDIGAFIDWINTYCRDHGRDDGVPADPVDAPITPAGYVEPWPGSSPDAPAAWSPQRSSTGTLA
jgi:hypothetical protein